MASLKIINNVVKSVVFGPIFIAQNDYIKLVTLQTCWMHLHVVMVAFQFILSPIEINGQYCVIRVSFIKRMFLNTATLIWMLPSQTILNES